MAFDVASERVRIGPGLRADVVANPDLQSALVRLVTCVLGAAYIGFAAWTHYYRIDVSLYLTVLGIYLLTSLALLVSVIRHPGWRVRRYLALSLDVIVVSLAILITQDAISPFYLLYILIFISAGTRFGRGHLILATLVAVVAYNFVLIQLDEWERHTYEAAFFLVLLILLPLYQSSLLRQIQEARDQAQRANKAKSDFLAVMTHELRTPLTGLVGMVELLKTTRLDAEQREHLRDIDTAANALAMLIGDILDLSKIEAGKLVLERIPFDPRDLVRQVCGVVSSKALEAGLELVCRVESEVPRSVMGDPLRVRQILFNLVGNAIKFTPQGQVLLRLSLEPPEADRMGARLLFEIVDSGIGISADKLDTLFERFTQVDDSTTRRFGGTGLGTTIARDLSGLMGGSIEVASEEGRGSRFSVRLPLVEVDDLPLAPDVDWGLAGLRVLVIERNDLQRACVQDALESAGCVVSSASESQKIARGAGGCDLLVIGDPPTGCDLASELSEVRRALAAEPPCLLLTYAGRRPIPRADTLSYLNKPFLAEDLLRRASALMGRLPESVMARDRDMQSALVETESAGGIRVLVAEDNPLAAKVLTAFLSRMGFPYARFSDGETALKEALKGVYDIAIVDLNMPKLGGIDFVRRYRVERADHPLPIVALTASASEEVRQDCLAAGMAGFLVKPVSPEALRQTIERLALVAQPAAG